MASSTTLFALGRRVMLNRTQALPLAHSTRTPPPSIRFTSTQTSQASSQNVKPDAPTASVPPPQSTGPSPPPPRQPSRHVLFYRDILPPMLRVLGYSAAVYFALQFTWSYLDAREHRTREGDGVRGVADKVRLAREEGDRAVAVGLKSVREGKAEGEGWRSWIKLGR